MSYGRYRKIFSPLMGVIAFSLKQSHGSCLLIEFGEPYLRIREPIEPRSDASEKSKILLRRRRVFVTGTWSLLVLGCDWTLTNEQRSVCQSDDVDDMENLFRSVEGQYLVSARGFEATKSCTLEFDMGASLTLRPRHDWDRNVEPDENQWQLHCKDGSSVGYTNDGVVLVESSSDQKKT
ncbi:conserved protein of unknown function [Paraburkholderia kururiensis]